MREFEQARDTEYEVENPSDREALQIAKSWYRHPAIRPYLTYNGVNLGELIEYHAIEELMPVLARARDPEVRKQNQPDERGEPSP
jgi:phosphatidylserine decarboxylase